MHVMLQAASMPDDSPSAQVIPMLIRRGHRRDYLIMNFGLHYTEDYKGELQTMVEQVSDPGFSLCHGKRHRRPMSYMYQTASPVLH